MLTDTDAARQIAQRIQAQDASLWEKIVQWFKDFEQKLRSAYNGLKPGSGIAKEAKKALQQVDGLVKMWADMAVDSAENYREAVPKDAGATYDDAMYSIRRTSNMSWGQQIKSTLNHNGKIQHMDTLVVMNNTPAYLLTGDTANLPMAIPLSVITKAQKGKNADHAISDKNLIALQYGMENAIAVIDNPARNSLAFITSLEEDGGKVAVFFDKNVQFDGDQVNKATSIHRRTNIVGLINNLPDNAIIYVKNKNEFDTLVGMADSIPAAYKGKIKFVDGSIAQGDDSVNRSGVINKKFSQRNSEGRTEEQNASGPYSYESLISKPDMAVTTLPEKVPKSRADVVYQAKQNAAKIGKFNTKDGSVSVYVEDTGHNVVLSTNGLKHSLDRRFDTNASVVVEAGNILANSIKINEMTPKRSDANESYILIGSAIGNNGDMYIVRSVVNSFKNELVSMDVLYAVNAKKMEPAAQMPRLAEKSTIRTGSTISISELLENVNEYFPDILPEDVLRHFGHESRPEGKLGESALYSSRKAETEESHKEELAKTRARLSKEAQERRENILRDYQKSRKISVENWRMTELGILKSAAENIASLDLSEREKKGLENFSGHLKKLEGIQGEIDAIRSKEGELSQQDLKKLTSLEQQADSMRKLLWEFSEYDVLKKVSQKTRKLLMDKYGSIKPGENPSRQADIPIQTNDLNRVSQTVRTAVEASATSDEMAEKIRQKVVEGEFSYLPITDDDSNKRAEETINRKGWDDALDDWIRIWTRKMLR